MPSHTFMHTGRFEAAAAVNADATYVAPRRGIDSDHVYPLHNREFLVWALRIEGRSAEALVEARKLAAMAQPCALTACTVPGCHAPESADPNGGRHYQRFSAAFVLTVALLGDAPELAELEDDKPPPELEYHLAMWHFAVGMVHARLAQARLGDLEAAATHVQKATESLRALEAAAASPGLSAAEEDSYRHPVRPPLFFV